MMTQSFTRNITDEELSLGLNHNTVAEIAELTHKDTLESCGQYSELVLVYGPTEISFLDFEDTIKPVSNAGSLREYVDHVEYHTGAKVRKAVFFD